MASQYILRVLVLVIGGGTFFKVGGGTNERQNTIENFCGLNWQL